MPQDSNLQVGTAMPGADVTFLDTLHDGAASPTKESTTEHFRPAARDHDGAAPPTTETDPKSLMAQALVAAGVAKRMHTRTGDEHRSHYRVWRDFSCRPYKCLTQTQVQLLMKEHRHRPAEAAQLDVDLSVPSVACGRLEVASAEHA